TFEIDDMLFELRMGQAHRAPCEDLYPVEARIGDQQVHQSPADEPCRADDQRRRHDGARKTAIAVATTLPSLPLSRRARRQAVRPRRPCVALPSATKGPLVPRATKETLQFSICTGDPAACAASSAAAASRVMWIGPICSDPEVEAVRGSSSGSSQMPA